MVRETDAAVGHDAARSGPTGWLDRLYWSLPTGYVWWGLAWLVVTGLFGGGCTCFVIIRLVPHPSDAAPLLMGACLAAVAVVVVVGLVVLRRDNVEIRDWMRRRDMTRAEPAWLAALNLANRTAVMGSLVCVLVSPALVAYAVGVLHESWRAAFPIAAVLVIGELMVVAYIFFMILALSRPGLSDVSRFVPAREIAVPRLLTVRNRTVLAFAVTTAFSAILAYAVGPVGRLGTLRVLAALGVAFGIAAGFTTFLTAAVTESIATPLEDLQAGTSRAAAGDLTTPVRVTTADEFGRLAVSFNRMLQGLRERETLRERGEALGRALRVAIDDLRASQARLVSVGDAERLRMERDMNAGARQSLLVLRLKLSNLGRVLRTDREAASRQVADLQEESRGVLEQLRDLGHGIYPAVLTTDGLEAALCECADRAPIPVHVDCRDLERLAPELEMAVYFCCAEAVAATAKRCGPETSVSIQLFPDRDLLRFVVMAGGLIPQSEGHGVQAMVDRVEAVGGRVEIVGTAGPTVVTGYVPTRVESAVAAKEGDRPASDPDEPSSAPLRRRTPTGGLYRVYRKLGNWYLVLTVVTGVLVALLDAGGTTVLLSRFVHHSHSGLVTLVLESSVVTVVMGCVVAWLNRNELATLWHWVAQGRPDADADHVATALIGVTPRAAFQGVLLVGAATPVFVIQFAAYEKLPWTVVPPLIGGFWVGIVVYGIYLYFTGQTLLAPILADAAWIAPHRSVRPLRLLTLRVRTMLALGITTVFSAMVALGVGRLGRPGPDRMLGGLAVAVAVGVVFTAFLSVSVTDSMATPLHHLLRGTQRVVAGDLSRPVPVTTSDEFGRLAASFNVMLSGLREREELRLQGNALNESLEDTMADLRASQVRLVSASDAVRRRMERDLHDGAQQSLVVIRLKLGRLAKMLLTNTAEAESLLRDLEDDATTALAQLQDLSLGIYPAALVDNGLDAAFLELAAHTAIPTVVDCRGAGRMASDLEVAIYFCCAEALANAAKYAGPAARAVLHVKTEGGMVSFGVRDDGFGFDPETARSSGLQNMRDRVAAAGGDIRIRSAPGQGTTVEGTIAFRPPVAEHEPVRRGGVREPSAVIDGLPG